MDLQKKNLSLNLKKAKLLLSLKNKKTEHKLRKLGSITLKIHLNNLKINQLEENTLS